MYIKETLLAGVCSVALMCATPAQAEGTAASSVNSINNTDSKRNAAANNAREISRIDDLPDNGAVNIKGVVSKVEDKGFVLKDQDGKTIDVSSPSAVSEGDQVSVKGEVKGAVFGIGDEIVANDVIVLSRR